MLQIHKNTIYVDDTPVAVIIDSDVVATQAFGQAMAKLMVLDTIEARIGSATADLVAMAKLVNSMAEALNINGAMQPEDVKDMLG